MEQEVRRLRRELAEVKKDRVFGFVASSGLCIGLLFYCYSKAAMLCALAGASVGVVAGWKVAHPAESATPAEAVARLVFLTPIVLTPTLSMGLLPFIAAGLAWLAAGWGVVLLLSKPALGDSSPERNQ